MRIGWAAPIVALCKLTAADQTFCVFWCVSLQEEAVQVTGHTKPQAAAEAILSRPNTATEWCVVKMGGEGAVLVIKSGEVHHAPAFKVCMLAA